MFLKDILIRMIKQKNVWMRIIGFILEMLLSLFRMELLNLLIERNIFLSFSKENILQLKKLKVFTPELLEFLKFLFMGTHFKHAS